MQLSAVKSQSSRLFVTRMVVWYHSQEGIRQVLLLLRLLSMDSTAILLPVILQLSIAISAISADSCRFSTAVVCCLFTNYADFTLVLLQDLNHCLTVQNTPQTVAAL